MRQFISISPFTLCVVYTDSLKNSKNFPKKGPEARLYLACCAAVALPASMFMYAWTSYPHITWVAQAIGVTVSAGRRCRSDRRYGRLTARFFSSSSSGRLTLCMSASSLIWPIGECWHGVSHSEQAVLIRVDC